MSRKYIIPKCLEIDREKIMDLAVSSKSESRLVFRAKIIKGCLSGRPMLEIATELKTRSNTVSKWRERFEKEGYNGIMDSPRSGKPPKYNTSELKTQILTTLELPPPKGQAIWDGLSIAKHLGCSGDIVWKILRKEGICLQRQRSWCVSTDPQFAAKAADIVGLYLNPPVNAIVISVDEKPSIQALERTVGYVETDSGKIVRGYRSTYRRHGTLNLFAALEIATGAIHTETTKQKRKVEFLEFMNKVISDLPPSKKLHVILDNYCIHKKNDEWLLKHPNVKFHFTPTSASWLNMVEIWFGILSRKALKGASFRNLDELKKAIVDFIAAYTPNAKPFIWRKREVKGSQLRNTIVTLCN